jgi:hypothetical protein
MARSSSRGKLPLVTLVAILCALSLLIVWFKVDYLHLPLKPQENSELWTIEARIEFSGRRGPASIGFQLPNEVSLFTRVDESFVSRSFGLTLNSIPEGREARWTLRRSEGDHALFYRLKVYPQEGALEQTFLPGDSPEFPEIPPYPEPLASAIADLLNEAREESADIFSFAAQLLSRLANRNDENVKVIRDARPSNEWPQLVTEILAGARIPSRVIQGVSLQDDFIDRPLLSWVEVYNGQRWRGFDPNSGQMGYPPKFYPWTRGAHKVLTASGVRNLQVSYSVSRVSVSQELLAQQLEERLSTGLMNFTLYSLPIPTQEVYKVLLLVPLGALVVAFMRVVVGLPTFGTFTPILIALAFRETQLGWGLLLFLVIVIIGWGVRSLLENLRLLLVPRLACMLLVVIGLMLALSLLSQRLGFVQGLSIALFPMVILTMTIERMAIVWEELGAGETFKQTIGTLLVAISGYYVMNHQLMVHLLFNFPELLLVILAICLALGSYTGYRVSELLRFKDFNRMKP